MKEKLVKDKSIGDLLTHLETKFGKGSFIIEDYWNTDLCAIGITNPKSNYLLYITTYRKKELYYNIVVEAKGISGDLPYDSSLTFENLTLTELENYFQNYLVADFK